MSKSEDIVYLYPKTSCPCDDCGNSCNRPNLKDFKSNMSVRGCVRPDCFNCHSRVYLGKIKQPDSDKSNITEINPQVYTDKIAEGFGKMPCKQEKGCNDPTYMSWDPRLYSVTRYNYLPLDRPPMDGDVRLKNIYNPKWNGYGNLNSVANTNQNCDINYNESTASTPYEKIRDGQISYYIDKSIENAYFNPLFSSPAEEVAVLYQDPMGALKPEYTRVVKYENPVTRCQSNYPCTSFIQDTQGHREDLLSYQMRKRNQERWEPRWSFE